MGLVSAQSALYRAAGRKCGYKTHVGVVRARPIGVPQKQVCHDVREPGTITSRRPLSIEPRVKRARKTRYILSL